MLVRFSCADFLAISKFSSNSLFQIRIYNWHTDC